MCNFAVVATSLYRYTRNRNNEESLDVADSTEKTLTTRPTVNGEEFDQVTPISFTEVLEGTFENQSSGLRYEDQSEDRSRDSEGVRVL